MPPPSDSGCGLRWAARTRFEILGIACAALLLATACGGAAPPPERLTELVTPRFGESPPDEAASQSLATVWRDLAAAGPDVWLRVAPNQAGTFLIGLVIVITVGLDFDRSGRGANTDLLLLQALALSFFEILRFFDVLDRPSYRRLLDLVFWVVVLISVALLVRTLWRVYRPPRGGWAPTLSSRALATLAIVLLAADVICALARPPDDAGFYVNVGAQRLRERGEFPYGDPLLTSTPAAAYGPVLYLAHVPFQLAVHPAPVNPTSPDHPRLGAQSTYFLPPMLATKLCVVAFHVIGVVALWQAMRRLRDRRVAWAVTALYCGSPFVLGMGGERYAIGGMTFVSHIAPAALSLVAYALLMRPMLAGGALALAAGALFYPVFFVPAWLGFYARQRAAALRFLAGLLLVGVAIGVPVLLRSRPAEGRGVVGTFLHDTLGHQESDEAYGRSPFGFWGQRGGVRGWLMTPAASASRVTRPIVFAFFVFVGAAFFMTRGRSPVELALVTAAVAIGATLWKVHATGTYVTWYLPFLLIGLFAWPGEPAQER